MWKNKTTVEPRSVSFQGLFILQQYMFLFYGSCTLKEWNLWIHALVPLTFDQNAESGKVANEESVDNLLESCKVENLNSNSNLKG